MNTDIRLKTSFRDHRKRKKLQRKLGAEGVLAFIDLMLMSAQTRPDGILVGMDQEDIALDANWDGDADTLVNELVDIGLLDVLDDGTYTIHDWQDHNAYAANAGERSESARKAAKARWDKARGAENAKPHADSCDAQCDPHATRMQDAQNGNAPSPSPSPYPSPEEIPSPDGDSSSELRSEDLQASPEPAKRKTEDGAATNGKKRGPHPNCPHDHIVQAYHEELPELPVVQSWNGASRKNLQTRWREDSKRQDLNWWRWFFREHVRSSDFLMGRVKEFRADLDWIVRPTNFQKILNGRYQNRGPNTGSKLTDQNYRVAQEWATGGA